MILLFLLNDIVFVGAATYSTDILASILPWLTDVLGTDGVHQANAHQSN